MGEFYGNYRGEVIRVDDPLKAGRVKIRIFGVYDDLLESEIPWAIYADPLMGGQSNIGSAVIPNVDSKVWCFFEGGEHHYPVYWAGAPAMDDPETPHIPEESRREESEYSENKVFRTKNGFVFEIDDTGDSTRLRVLKPSGNEYVSDHEGNDINDVKGNVEETIQGTETRTVEDNVSETLNGTLDIDVEGKVTFKAPEMQFGEDGAVEQSVLGKQLEEWLNNVLIPWINAHTHTGNLSAPTSPPITPFEPERAAPSGALYSKVNTNQ